MTQVTAVPERTHRFALSVSGGIALGSYEAGVLSQFYRDICDFNAHAEIRGKARVTIDAIAGASAGSVTGLILAQALALGHAPDELERRMRTAWVDLLEIQNLLTPSDKTTHAQGDGLFTDTVVEDVIRAALDIPPAPPPAGHAPEPLALWVTLTNLDGVPFVIDFERKDEYHAQAGTALYALDYRDYVPFLITGDKIAMIEPRMPTDAAPDAVWRAATAAAQASGAFPVAFPSRYQTRDLTQYPRYRQFKAMAESPRLAQRTGEPNLQADAPLPDTAVMQFADGGLFNNEPIGKCIDAVAYLNTHYRERDPESSESGGMVGRSFVIIEPEPQLPSEVEQALRQPAPEAGHTTLPHSLLSKILGCYFNSALYGDFETAAKMNEQINALNKALARLDELGLDADTTQKLKAQIKKAVGLDDKAEITLHRIPHDLPPGKRLAGAFAGHFGGFLRRDFREADFLTGRHEARHWFAQWLTLWLQSHAEDIGRTRETVSPEFVQGLLSPPPPDPATEPIPPTGLTPRALAESGWFPQADDQGNVSEAARLAALTEDERAAIIALAEARGQTLLEAWLHLSPLVVRPAAFILAHLFNSRFVEDKS